MATSGNRRPGAATPMTPRLVVASAACGPFTVTEFVQPAGMRIPRHEHAEATLAIVVAGEMVDTFGRQIVEVAPGAAGERTSPSASFPKPGTPSPSAATDTAALTQWATSRRWPRGSTR